MKHRAFFAGLCVLAVFSAPAADTGDFMPGFANPDLKGTYVLSTGVLGSSWLILDFFATDCEPCTRELPALEDFAAGFASSGLKVLVFATDPGGESVVRPFFTGRPPSVTVLIDRYRVSAGRFGVDQIPAAFLVDPSGVIRYRTVGYAEGSLEEMRRIMNARAGSEGGAP